MRNYSDALRPVIERYSAKPLQKLTTQDVEDLVDAMLTSGRKRGGKPGTPLSPRIVQLTLSRLRSALNDAVNRHLLEWNPAAPVKCPDQVRATRLPWSEVMGDAGMTVVEKAPKTASGRRSLPLPAQVTAALRTF